jgi:dihydrofolate reductase
MKIIMAPALTLDGFIADPHGECHSWINPADEDRYEASLRPDGVELVGRKTYEQYLDTYESRTDVMTFVYTSQSKFKDTAKIKFVHGDIHEILKRIEALGFNQLIFSGGGELNGLLATAGVIDEIEASIHPVTIGAGIPLFGSYHPKLNLKLLSTNQDIPGITQIRYEVLK